MSDPRKAGGIRLRLPATSANLGPGFDAVAIALDFFLEIAAEPALEFSIAASGRDAERCARLEDNLILETYKRLLREHDRNLTPLSLRLVNEIPLGMGCGSSAAAHLAAIALANHFGELRWDRDRILEEANALEGHPDNVAACWLGGFVAALTEGKRVHAIRVDPPEPWRAIVVLPSQPLSTSKSRAMLPASYPLKDVVANLQSIAALVLAFAEGRADLLRLAMADRIHQPYRESSCPLLPLLLPLAGKDGILGVSLSGAGPAILVTIDGERGIEPALAAIRRETEIRQSIEPIKCGFSRDGVTQLIEIK